MLWPDVAAPSLSAWSMRLRLPQRIRSAGAGKAAVSLAQPLISFALSIKACAEIRADDETPLLRCDPLRRGEGACDADPKTYMTLSMRTLICKSYLLNPGSRAHQLAILRSRARLVRQAAVSAAP